MSETELAHQYTLEISVDHDGNHRVIATKHLGTGVTKYEPKEYELRFSWSDGSDVTFIGGEGGVSCNISRFTREAREYIKNQAAQRRIIGK